MAFLAKDELRTKSHIEIIDAITRGDDSIIEIIISESITYMRGYLTARYDCDKIFSTTGTNRDQVVLKMLKAIVIYEIYSSHNPQMMTRIVEDSNKRAIEWLKSVQKTEINPDLPMPEAEGESGSSSYLKFGSNTKRGNHY